MRKPHGLSLLFLELTFASAQSLKDPSLKVEQLVSGLGFNSGWEQIMVPDSRDPQGTGNLFVVPGSHYSDPKFSWVALQEVLHVPNESRRDFARGQYA